MFFSKEKENPQSGRKSKIKKSEMERNIPNIIGLKWIHIQDIFKPFKDIFKLSFPQKVEKVGKTEILITVCDRTQI